MTAAEHFTCEHAWKHTHYPGAYVYWISFCMLCGYLNVADLNQQIREIPWWRRLTKRF
jgi:hypothetical protein